MVRLGTHPGTFHLGRAGAEARRSISPGFLFLRPPPGLAGFLAGAILHSSVTPPRWTAFGGSLRLGAPRLFGGRCGAIRGSQGLKPPGGIHAKSPLSRHRRAGGRSDREKRHQQEWGKKEKSKKQQNPQISTDTQTDGWFGGPRSVGSLSVSVGGFLGLGGL